MQNETLLQKNLPDGLRGPTATGTIVIVLLFGAIGIWGYVAPLESTVVAEGRIAVETERKIIQHLEGGIVQEILVKESDFVVAGQPLLRLQPLVAQSKSTRALDQYNYARASEHRLQAEINSAKTFPVSEDMHEYAEFLPKQKKLFDANLEDKKLQLQLLDTNVAILNTRIKGYEARSQSMRDQISVLQEEIEDLSQLFEKGYVSRTRILALERELFRLEGAIGQNDSRIADALEQIAEQELQKSYFLTDFRRGAVEQLSNVRQFMRTVSEELAIAQNELERVDVLAPLDGYVQNVQIHTIGGIISPAQPLMEIVPAQDLLIIRAAVFAQDRDAINMGQQAEIQFSGIADRNLPIMRGTVKNISPDAQFDENLGFSYYDTVIHVDEDLPEIVQKSIIPGFPAQVFITTGEKTVFESIFKSASSLFTRSLRET
ncbi:MAG: HlyD family type I secretion periplasmic adaptor subunit [Pseudomonadota bacterium]